jgi:hypothetical protein
MPKYLKVKILYIIKFFNISGCIIKIHPATEAVLRSTLQKMITNSVCC